jgi:hypothetical protein
MGQGMFSCLTKECKLQTVFGSCECAQSVCSCFANETEEAIIEKKIAEAIRIEIGTIGDQLKNAMHSKLQAYGEIPAIRILDDIMESPQPADNAVSVRIKSNDQAYSLQPEKGSLARNEDKRINLSIKPMDLA